MGYLLSLRSCLAILVSLYLLCIQVVGNPLEALPLQTKVPTKRLSKRGTLEDLWATVDDKIRTGIAKSWSNDVNAATIYAPTEFYGCTLVKSLSTVKAT